LPSSQHYQISKIIDLIINLNPNSILDIGAGFGKYGLLSREYLELWDGRQRYDEFTRRIDAVEAFEEYITPVHRFVYNNVYVDDVFNIIDNLELNYELVLLIDVLEHFDKEKGALLVRKILTRNGGIIISTPKKFINQIDTFGNEYEMHRSQWTQAELSVFGSTLFLNDDVSYICYLGKKEAVDKLEADIKIRKIGWSLGTKTRKFLGAIPLARRVFYLINKVF
jgi:2-polyprenyl-3-methyl-5-hydroxy-6-metoxy-1,4-benzoquinol methylase